MKWGAAGCAAWLHRLQLEQSFKAWNEFVCRGTCEVIITCLNSFQFMLVERNFKLRIVPALAKENKTFFPCPGTVAAMSFMCCNLGLENGSGETFHSQMWNFPSSLWKYLLKDRNWSLMVNSLSKTMQAHLSQTVFIYPYYYLEIIRLWVPLPPKVHCFGIDPKPMNLF